MSFNPNDYLINLKGKQYLQVAHRLMWFRDVHPGGSILTELINITPIVFKATILNSEGVVLGTGHGSATPKPNAVWAGREFEKAETAAIGRALGVAGFGTQYAEDFEDDDHLADSPVTPQKTTATTPKSNGSSKPSTTTSATPENAPTHGEERQITLTAVISEAGKAGQTRYRFASVERLEGVYAYSREVFINGGWCTELDWQKHGTYNLEAACVATVQYHAFQDGGGGYWTVEAVENFQPDFLADVMNASAVTHDTTDQHIDDLLKGELLDITRVEPRIHRGRTQKFQWIGHATFERQPITVLIFKEDEQAIREAGYDTSGWDTPDGRTYRDGGIALTTVKTTTGRQVASVWHISERRLVATERAS